MESEEFAHSCIALITRSVLTLITEVRGYHDIRLLKDKFCIVQRTEFQIQF